MSIFICYNAKIRPPSILSFFLKFSLVVMGTDFQLVCSVQPAVSGRAVRSLVIQFTLFLFLKIAFSVIMEAIGLSVLPCLA